MGTDTLAAIINKHGADKVCFGTDFPLADMAKDSQFIESLAVSDAAKERILGENFRELAGL